MILLRDLVCKYVVITEYHIWKIIAIKNYEIIDVIICISIFKLIYYGIEINFTALDEILCFINNLIDHIFIFLIGKPFSIYQNVDILLQRSMVLSDIFLYLFFVGSDIMLRFCSLRFISLPLTNLWTNLILRILV